MLEKIKNLPVNVYGVRAHGTITQDDYRDVLIPLLEGAKAKGKKINFLYDFSSDYEGFTPQAAWDDFRIGVNHLKLLEKCAVVSDSKLIGNSVGMIKALVPFGIKTFHENELPESIEWLQAPMTHNLSYELSESDGILLVEAKGELSSEDFASLSNVIDPWIKAYGKLNGLILKTEKFPGWEDFDSMMKHMKFIKDHHKKIDKVAFCSDSTLGEVMSSISKLFVSSSVKLFDYDDVDDAKEWVNGKKDDDDDDD